MKFVPTSEVNNLFPKTLSGDPTGYVQQLTTVPANANLYDIYAFDKPTALGGVETKIGTMKLKGSLVNSKWADENLFIRHQRMDDDLRYRPEWDPYCPKWTSLAEDIPKCPFGFS